MSTVFLCSPSLKSWSQIPFEILHMLQTQLRPFSGLPRRAPPAYGNNLSSPDVTRSRGTCGQLSPGTGWEMLLGQRLPGVWIADNSLDSCSADPGQGKWGPNKADEMRGGAETNLSALILMLIYSNLNSNTDCLLACLYFLVARGKLVQCVPENAKFTRICKGHEITKWTLDVLIQLILWTWTKRWCLENSN